VTSTSISFGFAFLGPVFFCPPPPKKLKISPNPPLPPGGPPF